ncbi:enoyl-CoA hydratase [Steroidobacter agaridevorans]|uniref:Enoyl-CoA hydratase n=1 Tax=Steroidobacter agaridevorans TaxID=2695856 RepID=A0A829YBW9_9GAMM|nr:enoyl-CoA hydratase-related protein [Steroidobacter agaridevorans]GFE80443.1 enoyl-CoA hydratase [Steroidobacter agaridevorans]
MTVRLEKQGAIARLVIDRAAKRNAITQAMWDLFPSLLDDAMKDAAIKVVILQSAVDGVFSAGADISEFATGALDPAWQKMNQAAIRKVQYELARAPKPVIALIDGDCVGGGCGLAIACDIRVASSRARFGITPAKLGLVYSLHDTKLLVDLVGQGQAKRMLFSGQLLDAAEAHRIGLVEILSENAAGEADQLADVIASNSPQAIRAIKGIVRRILDGQPDDDASTQQVFSAAFGSEDFAEGVAAFLAKRKAQFK